MKSPTARRIVQYWADLRPVWLWSQDGATLIWRNAAARYFTARIKKTGLKLNPEAVPIRGQVPRLIRLGTAGRSSLSRVQFLAGEKPVATTCSCTPLTMPDGTLALLLVAIDPLPAEVLAAVGPLGDDAAVTDLLPAGADYLLTEGTQVLRGSTTALADRAPALAEAGLPDESDGLLRFIAGPGEATLLVYLPRSATAPRDIAEIRAEEGESADDALPSDQDLASTPEPLLPLGLETVPEAESVPLPSDEWVEPLPPPPERALSSLFDRLAEDATLYTSLSLADETFEPPAEASAEPPAEAPAEPPAESQPPLDHDMVAAVIDYADDPESTSLEPTPAPDAPPARGSASQWLITGRGFRALTPKPPVETSAAEPEAPAETVEPPAAAPDIEPPTSVEIPPVALEPPAPAAIDEAADAETAERVSRYNFEELGRILTDRVSGEPAPQTDPVPPAPRAAVAPEGVINLNAETLVLNRLPLAILVFRDQQVLFANRALMDLLGHDSAQGLRSAGIASIFPTDEAHDAGPVNRLVRRDGTQLPVSARLQSVSWQGRAALMLSASPAEAIRTHEGAVRAFAELAAEAREEGFVLADRAGNITHLSGTAGVLLGRAVDELAGKPLALLVGRTDMEPLRQFLEKPARFTETARPSVVVRSEDGSTDIALFAEGQAGIVTGYFGFLSPRHKATADDGTNADAEIEPGMLGRLSRGIRRPLNSIIGFADMMRATPAQLDTARYAEYARDIRTAGLEIAVLVDELDDFTRLRDGQYAPRPSDVDLTALLEGCMARVRTQASAARVLVRSAISEALPRVRADRTSLGQALLNLLASAIDQTPIGGSVILSAQTDEEGNIAVHVRDGAQNGVDLGERFVVFRDGIDKDGTELAPVRSSVGLALTRSLLAVNACSLSVDPTVGTGTLFSLRIPADLVVKS
jgi:PAS domain-containing protein